MRSEAEREQISTRLESMMNKMVLTAAFAILAATAACSGNNSGTSFDNGLRPNAQAGTTCSPADSTCGSGLGNPSVQSPIEKHEQNVSPE
jgi:hypothetical protein